MARSNPLISVSGTVLTIDIGGEVWRLDNRIWGLAAAPSVPRVIKSNAAGDPTEFEPIIRKGRLAGSNMRFELEAQLFKDPIDGWCVDIYFRSQARKTYRFSDWASGRASLQFNSPRPGLSLGNSSIVIPRSPWSIDAKFKVTSDERSVAKPITFANERFGAAAALLVIEMPPTGGAADDPDGARFTFEQVALERLDDSRIVAARSVHAAQTRKRGRPARGIALARVGNGWIDLIPARAGANGPRIVVETYQPSRRRAAKLRVKGRGGFLDFVGLSEAEIAPRLRLDEYEFGGRLNTLRRSGVFVAKVTTKPHGFSVGSFALKLAGKTDALQMLANVDRALSGIAVRTKILSAHARVKGADRCDIAFENSEVELRFGRPATPPDMAGNVVDLRKRIADLSLDQARIQLRRTSDVFDLGFAFVGYRLRLEGKRSQLIPTAATEHRRLIAHFPPQHILEETFRDRFSPAAPPVPISTRIARYVKTLLGTTYHVAPPLRQMDEAVNLQLDPPARTFLARTLAAGPSRIAFQFPGRGNAPLDLTLDLLADWSGLQLVTHRRAAPAGIPLERAEGATASFHSSQLDIANITKTTSRDEALEGVRGSLTPPGETETALELVTGLIFSPDPSATFDPPPKPLPAGDPILWTAQYPGDRSATRAIWAPDFDLGVIATKNDGPAKDPGDLIRFETVPDARQRREIVGLTSAFGLAALRALKDDGSDSPASLVRLPEATYAFLSTDTVNSPTTGQPVLQEGVFMPKPFARFDAKLSAIGTSLDAEWYGEPPAGYPKKPFFRTFGVERYEHRSRHGRDSHVVVLEKGFLFPIGLRVTLVTLAERHYLPFKGDGATVAYLIKRQFIRKVTPSKRFPALYQPFDAKDLHFRAFELVTEQTPDIITKAYDGFGTDGQVFWPRTAEPGPKPRPGDDQSTARPADGSDERFGHEFAFEYRLDGSDVVRRAPFLFVNNRAAHDPDDVRKIFEYYNALTDDPITEYLTQEQVPDAPTIFAPARNPGETSFKTRRVSFAARPRLTPASQSSTTGQVSSTPLFDMDGFMEGENQPPWYPVTRYADIALQTLDRLTGRPNGLVRVGYDPTYVTNGFDRTTNPSELYLRVVGDSIDLDVSGQGNSAGGVAKPNARLAALSRRIGFVGGTPAAAEVLAPSAPDPFTTAPGSASSFGLEAASSGKFNPLEFFGGALAEAKLLGIISLKDVVKVALIEAAPLLDEQFQHGLADSGVGDATQALAKTLADVIGDVSREIDHWLTKAGVALAERLGLPSPTGGHLLDDLYPELSGAMKRLQATLVAAKIDLGSARTLSAFSTIATAILQDSNLLLAAIEEVSRNPVPPVVTRFIESIRKRYEELQTIVAALAGDFTKNARDILADLLAVAARDIVSNDLAEALLGPAEFGGQAGPLRPGESPISTGSDRDALAQLIALALNEPERAAARVERALFATYFGSPLMAALGAVRQRLPGVSAILDWSRATLADEIAQLLSGCALRAWRAAAGDSQGSSPTLDNRLLAPAAFEVVRLVDEALTDAVSAGIKLTLPEALRRIGKQIDAGFASVLSKIETARSEIDVEGQKTSAGLAAVLAELKSPLTPAERVEREAAATALRARLTVLLGASSVLAALVAWAKTPRAGAEIREALQESLKRTLGSALEAQETQLQQIGKDAEAGLARGAGLIAERMLEALKQTETFGKLAKAGAQVADWWTDGKGGEAIDAVFAFVEDMFAEAGAIAASVERLDRQLAGIALPSLPPSSQVLAFRDAVASGRASLKRLRDDLERIVALRADAAQLKAHWESMRGHPTPTAKLLRDASTFSRGRMLGPAGRALELRGSLVGRMRDLTGKLRRIQSAIPDAGSGLGPLESERKVVEAGLANARASIVALGEQLTALGARVDRTRWSRVSAVVQKAGSLVSDAKPAIDAAESEFTRVADEIARDFADAAASFDRLEGYLDALDTFTSAADKQLVSTILATAAMGSELADDLIILVAKPTNVLLKILIPIHERAGKVVGDLAAWAKGASSGDTLVHTMLALFAAPLFDRLQTAADALAEDYTNLLAIQTAIADNEIDKLVTAIGGLQKRWKIADPGISQAIKLVQDMVVAVAKGQLDDLVSLDALKDYLKDVALKLVPTRVTLNYDWATPLSDFPADEPIFAINREAIVDEATPQIPPPGIGTDLILSSRVDVDLLTGKREAIAKGAIAPFKVHLLGSSLDLLMIYFKGAYFEAKPGEKVKFSADIDRVELGSVLQFIKPLQVYFGRFSFFALPTIDPLGVEAGFDYSDPFIDMVSIQFLNVSFGASMFLPFEDRHAEFRAFFATREAPFLIVVPGTPPMGGGGFIRLISTASGIVSFEIQLEFGAIMALNYSPLRAQGRVTAGIYLLQRDAIRILEGFVHAVGEGQIACFGISVNVEVKIRQENGGRMTGSSTYSVSFRMGFAKFSYRFTASYKIKGGGGGGGNAAQLTARPLTSGSQGNAMRVAKALAGRPAPNAPLEPRLFVPNKQRQWQRYEAHFSQVW